MGDYTRNLVIKANDVNIEDDNYRSSLEDVVKSFRSFGDALTVFLTEHGYVGDIKNVDEKVKYIKDLCKNKVLPKPRNMKQWFTDSKPINNNTAIRLVFAFELNIDEANDFFKRVSLTKGFDCHDSKEVVWYWCILKGKNYAEGKEAIAKIKKESPSGGDEKTDELALTSAIKDEISKIEDISGLVDYIKNNAFQFRYHNVTASLDTKDMWDKITGSNGLVAQEIRHRKEVDTDDVPMFSHKIIKGKGLSEWDIYRWILAIEDYEVEGIKKIVEKTDKKFDRNLNEVLKNNPLVHSIVAQSFPDRNGINKILNGRKVESETVRKVLILLAFFTFWVRRYINSDDYSYFRKEKDNERCRDAIDDYLLRSGFGNLYAGNPYDWIFIYCLDSEEPLLEFRTFISEMIAYKTERDI